MRIASIDIGSNTVLLLIAEVNERKITKTLLNKYRMPRISKGLTKENCISDEKIAELYEVLDEYKSLINEYKCDRTIVTATAGFRKAENSHLITDEVKEKFYLDIETIDGNTEARYSFLGASSDLPEKSDRLIIDIGGGSTELIYGNADEIKYSQSYPFGAVNLTEKFINSFPVSNENYLQLQAELKKVLGEIDSLIPVGSFTIAVAGTPTTLSCINQNLKVYDEGLVENSVLELHEVHDIIDDLKPQTPDEILERFGEIVKGRNDVLLTGALILHTVMVILNLDKVICSGKGIRYGAVVNYLQS